MSPQKIRLQMRQKMKIDPEDCVVGTVSYLTPFKGLNFLIDSAKRLLSHSEKYCFLIVGDGSERPALEDQIRTMGLEGKIHLLGHRRDIPELLSAYDIFALPSLSEGHPNALIEAMAVELPVVASDIAGVNETVEHSVSGLLVPSGDSEALAQAILELSQNCEMRKILGSVAKRVVMEKFDRATISQQYRDLYESLWLQKQ